MKGAFYCTKVGLTSIKLMTYISTTLKMIKLISLYAEIRTYINWIHMINTHCFFGITIIWCLTISFGTSALGKSCFMAFGMLLNWDQPILLKYDYHRKDNK